MIKVESVLQYIKDHTALELKPCDYFKGVYAHQGKPYFNLDIDERVSESPTVQRLEQLAANSQLISHVEPNGLCRVAVFLKA